MTSLIVQPPMDPMAYEQIEAAVNETSRGRWFLEEFTRRRRNADTLMVLAAIEKLERGLASRPAPANSGLAVERFQVDIVEMARAIARTEREMRAIRAAGGNASRYGSASDELESVVLTTEQATSDILSAAEKVQEQAWTMREKHGDAAQCDLLDACATEIYTACGFQDLTAQRIRKVTDTLRFLDQRLKTMLEALGLQVEFDDQPPAEPPSSPAKPDVWMSEAHQAEIDDTFDFFVPAARSEPTMVGAELIENEPVAAQPRAPTPPDPSLAVTMPPMPRPVPGHAAKTSAAEAKPAQNLPSQSVPPPAGPALAPAAPASAPAAPQRSVTAFGAYDALDTTARLRAFR